MSVIKSFYQTIRESAIFLKSTLVIIVASICYAQAYQILPFLLPYFGSIGMIVVLGVFYLFSAYVLMSIVFMNISRLQQHSGKRERKKIILRFTGFHIGLYGIMLIIQMIAKNPNFLGLANGLGMLFFIGYFPIQIAYMYGLYQQNTLREQLLKTVKFIMGRYKELFYGGAIVLLCLYIGSLLININIEQSNELAFMMMFEMNPWLYIQSIFKNFTLTKGIISVIWSIVCLIGQVVYLNWILYLAIKEKGEA